MKDAIFNGINDSVYSDWKKSASNTTQSPSASRSDSPARQKIYKLLSQEDPTYFNTGTNSDIRSWTLQMQQGVSDAAADPRKVVKTTKIEFLEDILEDKERYEKLRARSREIVSQRLRVGEVSFAKGITYARHFGAGLLDDGILDPGKTIGEGKPLTQGDTMALNKVVQKNYIERSQRISASLEDKIKAARFTSGENFLSAGGLDTNFVGYAMRADRVGVLSGSHLTVNAGAMDIVIQSGGQPGEIGLIGKQKPVASLLFSIPDVNDFLGGDIDGDIDMVRSMMQQKIKEILPAWEEEQIKAFQAEGGERRVARRARNQFGYSLTGNVRVTARQEEAIKPAARRTRIPKKTSGGALPSGIEAARAVTRGKSGAAGLRMAGLKSVLRLAT